jgi:hypothetical protein
MDYLPRASIGLLPASMRKQWDLQPLLFLFSKGYQWPRIHPPSTANDCPVM